MFDKDKIYSLKELNDLYSMYNLEFKFYGNNNKGNLEVYMKTDANKVSVFKSIDLDITKYDYLKLTQEEAECVNFKFDREVEELELDIVVVVLKTSDINIPSAKYSLESLDKLTKEQDLENRIVSEDGLEDGISYIIVDNNTTCPLYTGVYIFNKDNEGFIEDLRNKYENEQDTLLKDNLSMILNYYDNLEKVASL